MEELKKELKTIEQYEFELREELNKKMKRVQDLVEEHMGGPIKVLHFEDGTCRNYMQFVFGNDVFLATNFENRSSVTVYIMHSVNKK